MSRRDPQRKWLVSLVAFVLAGGLIYVFVALPKWDYFWAPITSHEWGPPALAMDTFDAADRTYPANALPQPAPEPVADRGMKAGEVYPGLEVLGDLDVAAFDRLQKAMTAWVAPEAGCGFCHATKPDGSIDAAAKQPYTYRVALAHLRLTRQTNADWPKHVMPAGVTCWTCHRGRHVPEYVWYRKAPRLDASRRWFQKPPDWVRTATTIRGFMPREPFEMFILDDKRPAGIQTRTASLPAAVEPQPPSQPLFNYAEYVYIFMMQMSDGLGVNCTYCHNSRAFMDWTQSTPNRVTAWYAINNTQKINHDWIAPLKDILPAEKLGPAGDPPKADCMTCHVGLTKPLHGAPAIADFPGLVASRPDAKAEAK